MTYNFAAGDDQTGKKLRELSNYVKIVAVSYLLSFWKYIMVYVTDISGWTLRIIHFHIYSPYILWSIADHSQGHTICTSFS
jgi:hypothetical protein